MLTSGVYLLIIARMPKRDPNKEMIGLWVRKELKGEIANRASEENRTVSNYIETLLMKHINQDDDKLESETKAAPKRK